jgi:hypothetical protein
MVVAHAVNVPGFAVPRALAASGADGRQISLVAAAVPPHRAGQPTAERFTIEAIAAAAVDAYVAKMTAVHEQRAKREELARRVGVDRESRVARLAARVGITKENP